MNKTSFFFLICTVATAITLGCNNSNPSRQKEMPDSTMPAPMPAPETAAFNAGTFKGTIPGGAQKDISITFHTDSTFSMKESYLSKEGKPEHQMDNTGKWSYDAANKSIYLTYKNLADRGTSFSIIDDNTIQLQERSIQAPGQAEKTNGAEYNLRRQ